MRRLIAAACLAGICVAGPSGCRKAPKSETGTSQPLSAKPVNVTRAERRGMTRVIAVTGTLAAHERSVVSTKVAGRLELMPVDIGTVFHEGDVLAQIEPRDYELGVQQATAALAQARTALGLLPEGNDDNVELEQISAVRQARAVLDEATANRERVNRLSQSGIAPQSDLDTAEAAYKVAISKRDSAVEESRTRAATIAQRRTELELARKRLADASIRAPFTGAVQTRLAHTGEYLTPGIAIVELVQTDPLRLRLQVPERECTLVRTGQVVKLFVEGDTNSYAGWIARLSPALDELSRMLLVEADVPARGSLRPGLFSRASIVVDEQQPGLSVPADALITFAGIEKVVLIKDGKAFEQVVTTGRRSADWVEILSGLEVDEQVIRNPDGIRTGLPVRVVGVSDQTSTAAKIQSAQATN